jgi:hypothetical protein
MADEQRCEVGATQMAIVLVFLFVTWEDILGKQPTLRRRFV